MIDQFAVFMPSSWFDQAGLERRSPSNILAVRKADKAPKTRTKRWGVSTLSAAVFVAGAVVLSTVVGVGSAISIFFAEGSSQHATHVPEPSTANEINNSFNGLFAEFRSGTRLIPNDNIRKLAVAAASHRNDLPDAVAWARKLASDVKDADD